MQSELRTFYTAQRSYVGNSSFEEIVQLEATITEQKQQITDWTHKLHCKQQECDNLTIKALNSDDHYTKQQQKAGELQKQLQDKSKEFHKTIMEKDTQILELKQQIQSVATSLDKSNSTLTSLKCQELEHTTKLQHAQEALSATKHDYTLQCEVIAKMQQQLQQAKSLEQNLQEQLHNIRTSLKSQELEHNTKLQLTQEALSASKHECAKQCELTASAQQQLQDLHEKLCSIEQNESKLAAQLNEVNNFMKQQTEEFTTSQALCCTLEDKLEAVQEQLVAAELQLSTAQKAVESADFYDKQLESKDKQLNTYLQQLNSSKEECRDLRAQMHSALQSCASLNETIKELRQTIAMKEQKIEDLNSAVSHERHIKDNMRVNIDQLMASKVVAMEMSEVLAQLQSEVSRLNADNTSLVSKYDVVHHQLKGAQMEANGMKISFPTIPLAYSCLICDI